MRREVILTKALVGFTSRVTQPQRKREKKQELI